jgi:sec-independent protein translocase protein TatA
MGGFGPLELTIILVIILIIFGAGKLPEIGAGLGKGIKNFKNATKGSKIEKKDPEPEKIEKQEQTEKQD